MEALNMFGQLLLGGTAILAGTHHLSKRRSTSTRRLFRLAHLAGSVALILAGIGFMLAQLLVFASALAFLVLLIRAFWLYRFWNRPYASPEFIRNMQQTFYLHIALAGSLLILL